MEKLCSAFFFFIGETADRLEQHAAGVWSTLERGGKLRLLFVNLIIALLLLSCGSEKSRIESSVSDLCRSRIAGDYRQYLEQLGGAPLLRALQNPRARKQFLTRAAAFRKSGTLFVEIYVRRITLFAQKRQAVISFIEKRSRGSGTPTINRVWRLEKIDGKWKVISL